MTKTQLLRGLVDFLRDVEHNDWSECPDYLFEQGLNCAKIDSYVVDAYDYGYEQWDIYLVESFPGSPEFIHFYFAIAWQGGNWQENPALLEVNPYVTTRYNCVKNWTDSEDN